MAKICLSTVNQQKKDWLRVIPLRSSISKAGKNNDENNIKKYNNENARSISNSSQVYKSIEEKLKQASSKIKKSSGTIDKYKLLKESNVSTDKFEELVFPLKLLDKNGKQIFIFENRQGVALQDQGQPVYAIKNDNNFQLIDDNHDIITSQSDWLKNQLSNFTAVEVEVFGKPKIEIQDDGTLKVSEVKPITADIDVLAYGYNRQVSPRRFSAVETLQEIMEKRKEEIIQKSTNLNLDYRMKENLIKKNTEDLDSDNLSIKIKENLIPQLKEVETNMTYLLGMGAGIRITHDITGHMRNIFPNIEISHGSEQFNLKFPQPLDEEWICISYKSNEKQSNEESYKSNEKQSNEEIDGIEVLKGEEELIKAFNKFKKDGLNMLPNPTWGWKLENGQYAIDTQYKQMFNQISKLSLSLEKDASEEQKKVLENLLNLREKLGIESVTDEMPANIESAGKELLERTLELYSEICKAKPYAYTLIGQLPDDKNNIYCQVLLNHAARYGDFDMVKFLVQNNKASVNTGDKYGKTALHYAARGGHLGIVKYLVENKADVNIKDKDNQTALHYAAEVGNLDTVKWLVENKTDVNIKDKYDRTALHYAAMQDGNLDTVKWLVENKADVNIKDKDNQTALHYAIQDGNLGVVKYLVENKADVNTRDEYDKTALHYAITFGHITECLIKNSNVDINAKDIFGYTALHYAIKSDNLGVVELLVREGKANVNIKDPVFNATVLHSAVEASNLDIVKWLVENSEVDVDAKNKLGETALDLAKKSNKNAIITELVNSKALKIAMRYPGLRKENTVEKKSNNIQQLNKKNRKTSLEI